MSARILILTAGFGEGHNAAARALGAACDELHGAGTAEVVDVFSRAAPRLNEFLRRRYLGLINHTPLLWRATYAWLHRSTLFPHFLRSMRRERGVLARVIADVKPAAIACTFPAYAFMLDSLRRAGRLDVPVFNVVTDSISINSLWWRGGAAGWFLPNEDSADVLRAAGVDARRLQVSGFPVSAFFAANEGRLFPPSLAGGTTPRVLHIINSGTRDAAETARRLLLETPWEVTCTVGRNEPLREELEQVGAGRVAPYRIFGWTDEIPRLLMTHHAVVSKAGGATTQEAIAARCPMIVSQVVPGQEEGNCELLRRHGVGARATTPAAVLSELHRAFEHDGRVWRQWREALEPLARPNAARDITTAIFAHAGLTAAPEPVPLPFRVAAASA